MDESIDIPNLEVPLELGSHGVPWDLKVLLYKGAAKLNRVKSEFSIKEKGAKPRNQRLPMVCAFHKAVLAKKLTRSQEVVIKILLQLWRFYAWCDSISEDVRLDNVVFLYRQYAEYVWHRLNIKKEISPENAYDTARSLADLIVRARKTDDYETGRDLLRKTRISAPGNSKGLIGSESEKKDPEAINHYGQILATISRALDNQTVRGSIPFEIVLEDGRPLLVKAGLKDFDTKLDPKDPDLARHEIRFIDRRKGLGETESPVDIPARISILNLRTDVELQIFIAQTGMSRKQASELLREEYRWKKSGEMFDAYRVFKGRRQGDALFRCYGIYRIHLADYVEWLDQTGISQVSDRLFPFLPNRGKLAALGSARGFYSINDFMDRNEIQRFGTNDLRKHSNNWLRRKNISQAAVSTRGAHSNPTNIRHYSRPNHQESAVQISQYFRANDPSITSPAGAPCEKEGSSPQPIDGVDHEAVELDCISPDGCLFCRHHRDVLSADYCWKLASHAKLKTIELSLNRVLPEDTAHPIPKVLDRIEQKLRALSAEHAEAESWINSARDSIRAGRYHPFWSGSILIAELL